MAERELVVGGFYRHFKDKLYQVRGIAYHSETKEKMVVYQALYGDYSMYVRPFDMFMREVDHYKYPDVEQKYRFEQVSLETLNEKSEAEIKVHVEEKLADRVTEDGVIDGRLLRFLDAENFNEKLNVLTYLKSGLDDRIIDAMAASMDVEVPAGSIEERYRSLRSVIMAHSKYECTRLRK
ncbi:MAG: DUF1653 domain-containing protein [Lachnospira sp.]|nr:DUF1653 domain-containing protein [Lachnospira sp.]